MRLPLPLLALLAAMLPAPAASQAEPVLLGRSGPTDGFLIPANTGFSNNDVALNDAGEAALRLSSIGVAGDRGIWYGDGVTGQVVAMGDPAWFFTDADLNNAAEIVWAQTDTPADGVYGWNPVSDTVSLITAEPLGTSSWGTVRINDAGTLGFRATFGGGGRAWVSRTAGGTVNIHAAEAAIQPGSPWDFLFTPSFNEAGQIGGKALLVGGDANQIIRTEPDGSFVVLVSDQTADGTSPFTSFDNSPAINDFGHVGFIGSANGQRGVWTGDGTSTTQLAGEGDDGVGDIEFFGPAIDNAGRVVFRAFENGGRRAIWLAEAGRTPQRLIGAGDLVDTDLGPARIDSPSGIEFSGGVTINESGQVGFIAVLTAPDDVNDVYGLGVFRLAFATELIFADGFESAE